MTDKIPDNSIFRILDAAINRAGEGLRVVEDYLRLVICDPHLSQQLKELRHDLTQAVAQIDPGNRIAARDSEQDVGRHLQTESEYRRDPIENSGPSTPVIQANLARCQQALRSIEEFSKTLDSEIAKQVEQIRYRTYTLEKAILTTLLSLRNLAKANLCVLVSGPQTNQESEFSGRIEQLVDAQVSLIQLRDKRLNDRQLVAAGKMIAQRVSQTDSRFIMNDRADLALAAGADGVHLGQEDLAVADARRILGAAKIIGVSTHSIEQARQAVLDGANYIGVGPVFHSQTKSFANPVGIELVKQVATEIQLPAFAIGGIDLTNVAQILQAGLHRVAVSAAVENSADPPAAALRFRQLLEESPPPKTLLKFES